MASSVWTCERGLACLEQPQYPLGARSIHGKVPHRSMSHERYPYRTTAHPFSALRTEQCGRAAAGATQWHPQYGPLSEACRAWNSRSTPRARDQFCQSCLVVVCRTGGTRTVLPHTPLAHCKLSSAGALRLALPNGLANVVLRARPGVLGTAAVPPGRAINSVKAASSWYVALAVPVPYYRTPL